MRMLPSKSELKPTFRRMMDVIQKVSPDPEGVYAKDFDKAVVFLCQTEGLAREKWAETKPIVAFAAVGLTNEWDWQARPSSNVLVKRLSSAFEFARRIGDRRAQCLAWWQLGNFFHNCREFEKSVHLLQNALKSTTKDDADLAIRIHHDLARNCVRVAHNVAPALIPSWIKTGMASAEEGQRMHAGSEPSCFKCATALGGLLFLQKRYAEAIPCLITCCETGHATIYDTLAMLASSYFKCGKLPETADTAVAVLLEGPSCVDGRSLARDANLDDSADMGQGWRGI